MSVTLLRAYGGFASGAVVTFPDSTESSLIAQGLATAQATTSMPSILGGPDAYLTQGGNTTFSPQAGQSTPAALQGPAIICNTPLGAIALTGYDTNGRVHVAGTMNLNEIYVTHVNTWKGIGVLNGTVVGTDNLLVALYSSTGVLIANSATAGALSAGASAFQNIDFVTPVTALAPGRYFVGVQCNGTTATTRRILSTFQPNSLSTSVAGTFGTIPATITVPTTQTSAAGVICTMYTT